MKKFQHNYLLIIILIIMASNKGFAQRPLPDELLTNTIEGQIDYIEERTRIYENYRAIREDMFQKINSNIIDSLNAYKNEIRDLNNRISSLDNANEALQNTLDETKSSLDEVTRTKNDISLFGLEISKVVYNSIMLVIIAALIILLVMGFMLYKGNRFVTNRTREDLKNLREEFEEYRQASRRAREKMTMDHFNEIKKLKEG
jgi:tetrahydromethanopterin S-methyltransferase subunit B